MSVEADSYKEALKDIRELILINGSHDTWLATQIILVIEECLPMTKKEAANTEWRRLTIGAPEHIAAMGVYDFMPQVEAALLKHKEADDEV
jgi:hypothetical protein